MKKIVQRFYKPRSLQFSISVPFTLVAVLCMSLLGVILYQQFSARVRSQAIDNTSQIMEQTALNLEDYLRNMRRISDAMYYSVIKDKDISEDSMNEEMNLLYEANKDKLISIACYTGSGELVEASPVSTEKPNVLVTEQSWFQDARQEVENFHFSVPHVQNLFDDSAFGYYWVISLSRSVELIRNGVSLQGVLLVDMNYSSVLQLLQDMNENNSDGYIFLMDSEGNLIYHPRKSLLQMGEYSENSLQIAGYEDGTLQESFEGESRVITVKTISYTGWKLVSVIPVSSFSTGMVGFRYLLILLVGLALIVMLFLNQVITGRVVKPLELLNQSVREWESGNKNPKIYIGGSVEIQHLGRTLESAFHQNRQLMNDIVIEQEEKRKSELDALQSQINPHFLYNTLDSIVWMITGERYEDAVYMITQLASLFRVSLSQGRTIITVGEELRHAQNYMNIQNIRFKNKFQVKFDIDPDILSFSTVKLVLQPLLENAIYYGMEYMEDEGEILVRGYRRENDLYLQVKDNGLGMEPEAAAHLLLEHNRTHAKGSGVGLINVHNRLQLRFGPEYGLIIESFPDEGMSVTIHIPCIPYTPENARALEKGHKLSLRKNSEPGKEEISL